MKNLRNNQGIATKKQFESHNLSGALLTKVAGGKGIRTQLDRFGGLVDSCSAFLATPSTLVPARERNGICLPTTR